MVVGCRVYLANIVHMDDAVLKAQLNKVKTVTDLPESVPVCNKFCNNAFYKVLLAVRSGRKPGDRHGQAAA